MKKYLFLFLFSVGFSFVLFSFPTSALAWGSCTISLPEDLNAFDKEKLPEKIFPSGNIPLVVRFVYSPENDPDKEDLLKLESRLRASLEPSPGSINVDGVDRQARCELSQRVILNSTTMDTRFDCELPRDPNANISTDYSVTGTILLARTFFDIRKLWDPDEEMCSGSTSFKVSNEVAARRYGANSRCRTGSIDEDPNDTETWGGVETALGCIPTGDLGGFISILLRITTGIAGGVALILIISAGFTIATSTGNPDKLKEGQEQLTSAITGLILVVLAVFLLEVIGAGILEIPGITK